MSTHEAIQCLVITTVILILDTILSSRTSVATQSPQFGSAHGRYSCRNMILLWLWYCKRQTTPLQQIISAMKLIQWIRSIGELKCLHQHKGGCMLSVSLAELYTHKEATDMYRMFTVTRLTIMLLSGTHLVLTSVKAWLCFQYKCIRSHYFMPWRSLGLSNCPTSQE